MVFSLLTSGYHGAVTTLQNAASLLYNPGQNAPLQPAAPHTDEPVKNNAAALNVAGNNMENILRNKIPEQKLKTYVAEITKGRRDLKNYIYETSPNLPVFTTENFPDLSKEDIGLRKELALRIAKENPGLLAVAYPRFLLGETDHEFRKSLVKELVKNSDFSPMATIKLKNELPVGAFERVKSQQKRAQRFLAPLMVANRFEQFNIHDPEFIAELGCSLLSQGYGLKEFIEVVKDEFPQPEKLHEQKWNWFSALTLGEPIKAMKQPVAHQFFCNMQLKDLFGKEDLFAPELRAPLPQALVSLQETVRKQKESTDAMAHEELLNWLSYTGCLFLGKKVDDSASAQLQSHLSAIQQFHSTHPRYNLSRLLSQALTENVSANNDFFAFSDQFKPYGKLFAISLFSMTGNGGLAKEDEKKLIALLNKTKYKKSSEQMRTVTWLESFAMAKEISAEDKCRLLKICLPEPGVKNDAQAFDIALQEMAFLIDLSEVKSPLGVACREKLKLCHTPQDAAALIKALLPHVFTIAPEHKDTFAASLEAFDARSPFPRALLTFAGKIHSLFDEQKNLMTKPFDRVVKALLFPDQKLFKKERYDPAASPHLALLKKVAPESFEKWRDEIPSFKLPVAQMFANTNIDMPATLAAHVDQKTYPLLWQVLHKKLPISDALKATHPSPSDKEKSLLHLVRVGNMGRSLKEQMQYLDKCMPLVDGDLLEDLESLKGQLEAKAQAEKFSKYTVGASDDPRDLTFFNAEVHNCQDIVTGDIDDCKAVLDEILNGANMPLVVKDHTGKIVAHRTLKVLFDLSGDTPQPVLHLEMQYPKRGEAHGLPKEITEALVEAARQISQKMGWPLTTIDETIESSRGYPAKLESLGSPAPYAYEDSLEYLHDYRDDIGMTNGIFAIPHMRGDQSLIRRLNF